MAFFNALSSESEFDDPAFEPDHRGVGAIVGAQLGKDAPDLTLDGVFGDRELRGNLFIGIALGDQAQDAHFRRRQGLIGGMLGELERDLRGKASFFPACTARIVSSSSLCRLFFKR